MVAARKRRQPLAVQRCDGSTSIVTGNRFIETLEALKQSESRGISSLTQPGIRLSHYVSVLRHKYGFPIHMEKIDQPSGIGWYGRYTLLEKISLENVPIPEKRKPATAATVQASNLNPISENGGLLDASL